MFDSSCQYPLPPLRPVSVAVAAAVEANRLFKAQRTVLGGQESRMQLVARHELLACILRQSLQRIFFRRLFVPQLGRFFCRLGPVLAKTLITDRPRALQVSVLQNRSPRANFDREAIELPWSLKTVSMRIMITLQQRMELKK